MAKSPTGNALHPVFRQIQLQQVVLAAEVVHDDLGDVVPREVQRAQPDQSPERVHADGRHVGVRDAKHFQLGKRLEDGPNVERIFRPLDDDHLDLLLEVVHRDGSPVHCKNK